MEDAIPVIRQKTDEFGRAFGRHYAHFVEEYMLDDADIALVISGGHAVTCRAAIRLLRERGIKVGMARLMWIRPFPSDDLRAALRGVKAVGVVDASSSHCWRRRAGAPPPTTPRAATATTCPTPRRRTPTRPVTAPARAAVPRSSTAGC
jgi:hypothetical protein